MFITRQQQFPQLFISNRLYQHLPKTGYNSLSSFRKLNQHFPIAIQGIVFVPLSLIAN